jgi:plasmid segregation protein ParM
MQGPHPAVVGLDAGHSAVKVAASWAGRVLSFAFPSAVTEALILSELHTRRQAEAETVLVDGRPYFIGKTAMVQGRLDREPGLSDSWVTGPHYEALVRGALEKLARLADPDALADAWLVVGLPARLYATQKLALAAVMAKVYPAARTMVLPQPYGPFMSVLLDGEGCEQPGMDITSQNWGVVEVGHFTTDLGVVRGGMWVERLAGSCAGASIAAEKLAALVTSELRTPMSPIEATQALSDGFTTSFGKRVDLGALVARAATPLVDEVLDNVSRLLDREARSLDGIALAGGGAPFLTEALSARFPHVHSLPDARMSVAEGFRRFGCAKRRAAIGTPTEARVRATA